MEPVGTLMDLIIFELIRCKYKSSKLPSMISKIAYKERKFGEYATDDDKELLYHTINRISEHWEIPGRLTYLKNRIAVCFRGLVLDILTYASGLAEDMKQYNTGRVTLCVDSICLTQSGTIDKAKTVLTILKKTEFLLDFHPGVLFRSFVMLEDLRNAGKDVLNAIQSKTHLKDQVKISKIKKEKIEKSLVNYYDLFFVASNYYAESQVVDERTVKMAAGALLLSKDSEGVRRVCDMMTIENRMKFLKENLNWLIGEYHSNEAKMIVYLSLNLPREEWIEVLKENFVFFFRVLLFDWRNRQYAINIFQDSLDFIDFKLMKQILDFASSLNHDDQESVYHDKYANSERIQVLKIIWMNTPMQLRNDIKQQILKSHEAAGYDAEFLQFVLESYPVSEQGEIISEIMKAMGGYQSYKHFSYYDKIFKMYLYQPKN